MMRLFLNGLGASSSSGLTYIRNVVPHLAKRAELHTTVAVNPQMREELGNLPAISFVERDFPVGTGRRFWKEQTALPRLIQQSGADVLLSAGDFALWRSPVPQILLSGNSLYTSADFFLDLRGRREYGLWLDTRMKRFFARRSVHWADCTVAPSQSFAEDLMRWTGKAVTCAYHGFDPGVFFSDNGLLPPAIQQKLDSAQDALRLLFVSHYNYYRNFETLLRAVRVLRDRLGSRRLQLFLTCRLGSGENPGSYRPEGAAALVERLGIRNEVVELGAIPYRSLHRVYRACDIYVTSAYAETFAHPVVEAMACGLPVVASEIKVHREICGAAALYFPRFSPEEIARRVMEITSSSELRERLVQQGHQRAAQFSWQKHVDEIVELAMSIKESGAGAEIATLRMSAVVTGPALPMAELPKQ